MDPAQDVGPSVSSFPICFDSSLLLIEPPRPTTIALKLLNEPITGFVMILKPWLQMAVSDYDPNMPGGNHAGGELVAIETDSTSGPRQDRELVQGVGERLHSFRLVLGPIDRSFVEADVVASSGNSTGGLLQVRGS